MVFPGPAHGLGRGTDRAVLMGGIGISVADLILWIDFDSASGSVQRFDRDTEVVTQVVALGSAEVNEIKSGVRQILEGEADAQVYSDLESKLNEYLDAEGDSEELMDHKTTREQ